MKIKGRRCDYALRAAKGLKAKPVTLATADWQKKYETKQEEEKELGNDAEIHL